MAKVCFSKAKIGQKSKKNEGKKSYTTCPGRDLNPGPLDYEADVLSTELLGQRRNLVQKLRYLKPLCTQK